MAAYATTADVQARMSRTMSESEQALCAKQLEDAAVLIDAYNKNASDLAKLVVSCRMVLRCIGSDTDVPMGATQGSMSALGYTQSWTIGAGTAGELYIGKEDKKLLGVSRRIGSYSPVQELTEKRFI